MQKRSLLLAVLLCMSLTGCDETAPDPIIVDPSEPTSTDFTVEPKLLTLYEGGSADKITIKLQSRPSTPVYIFASTNDPSEIELMSTVGVLDETSWSTGYAFYIKPLKDNIVDGNQVVTVTFALKSEDPLWRNVLPATVQVLCIDSDTENKDCTMNPNLPGCNIEVDCTKTPDAPECKQEIDCTKTPDAPECKQEVDCTKTPDAPECKQEVDCTKTPDAPECKQEVDCTKTPDAPECKQEVDCTKTPDAPECKQEIDCTKTPDAPECKQEIDCSKTPNAPECKQEIDCTKTPNAPECKQEIDCSKTPNAPECKQEIDCTKTPDVPECKQEIDCEQNPSDPSCPQHIESCNVEKDGLKIRFMAANTTSGNKQNYNDGKGLRMFQAMKPDIVVIQEFNYKNDTDADIRAMVTNTFGADYHYYRGTGTIPNGVISRYPIISSGHWPSNKQSNRDWDWAVIDIPGSRDLLAVSVHLGTSTNSAEMGPLHDLIKAKQKEGNYYVVFGGDFNTSSRKGACDVFGASSGVFTCSATEFPTDQEGNGRTSGERDDYYDYLLLDKTLSTYEIPVSIGTHCYPNGHVLDSRIYDYYNELSDIAPVQAKDSWLCAETAMCCENPREALRDGDCLKRASTSKQSRNNFQHMPVIRDIVIPM